VRRRIVPCLLLAFAGLAAHADTFTIRSDWFDRGNVDHDRVAKPYADKHPCIANGGKVPNQAEYDIDFPVTADYAVHALYASAEPRPVDILIDGKKIARGFKSATGSFKTSQAKWEEQCTVHITQGKHTVKLLCPGPCIPHICALRFEAKEPFPEGWRLDRRVATSGPKPTVEAHREGFVGFYPVNPPNSYDYVQPYRHVPLPEPRAHRVLEYVLIQGGKHPVTAAIESLGGGAGRDASRNELLQGRKGSGVDDATWVAKLSVTPPKGSAESDTLPLSPARLGRMLGHTAKLIEQFHGMPNVAPDAFAAERLEADKITARTATLLATPDSAGKWRVFYGLYVQAYKLKNQVALRNPLLAIDRLLLARRLTYNTSHIYTTHYDGSGRYKAGSGVFTLSPVRPDGALTCLTPTLKTEGIYRDPDLSWDGARAVFSYKPDPKTPCRIYEVGASGGEPRQLTDTIYDDTDPCYLPDGRIAFISTRCERVTLCHNAFTVSVLHTMAGDGGDVRCISSNTIHDFTPSVLNDGAIAVAQWRYVDKHVGNNQSLWRCNPDGTRLTHIAGAHFGPVTYWGARQAPGSSAIACILGPHMPYAVGPVAIVHPMFTHSSPAAYTNLTPEIPPPSHASWQRRESGYYADVFPLSEDYFLVSYCYGPDERAPSGYGIYLLDRWNNRDLVYRDAELSSFEPFPVRPRRRPPVIPPRDGSVATPNHEPHTDTAWGEFFCLNVTEGLPGVAQGEVKYLRIVEEIPKPVSSRTRGHRLQNPAISDTGHFALKRLWGTAPVEADGSAFFKAPANKAIYFSALDKDFMEVQRMRTFVSVAPGEQFGCVGCHELKHSAPVARDVLALRRPASAITPPPDTGVRAPDFYYDVQPVLDRHCVKCHSGAKPKGNVDLGPDYTRLFSVAYETLVRRGFTSYVNIYQVSTLVTRPPKYYGSHASKVIANLRTTHKDRVKMPPGDLRRLVTWIDCNAPYYGTYAYTRPNTTGGRDIFAAHDKALGDVYKRRCQSCHKGNAERTVHRFRLPATATRALAAPLAKAAGGEQTCGKPIFADAKDPDYAKLLAVYRAIESNPRVDMRRTRPPLTDPKCRYVYRPGAVREGP